MAEIETTGTSRLAELRASARGWHGVQLAALGCELVDHPAQPARSRSRRRARLSHCRRLARGTSRFTPAEGPQPGAGPTSGSLSFHQVGQARLALLMRKSSHAT